MNDYINLFYSTYIDGESRSEYDLLQLSENSFRGAEIMYADSSGNVRGGNPYYSATIQKDYDEACFNAIMTLDPVYRIPDFLDHHFNFYNKKNRGEKELFLKHIQYVIVPMLKMLDRNEYVELTVNWINKQKTMLLQQQLKEKNEFLKKAYEVAVEYSAGSPLSVSINPGELGASIGFEESTVRRIMNELVQEEYVTSGLGMRMLMVTQEGLNYLRRLEYGTPTMPPINVTVGDNSNFQFQNGTVHSSQAIDIRESSIEDFNKTLEDVRNGLAQFAEYLTREELKDLQAETDYLENNLQRTTPNRSKLKAIKDNIMEILKAVPANIIANAITNSF